MYICIILIYISYKNEYLSVFLYVQYTFLSGWSDIDTIVCVYSSDFRGGLDSELDQVSSTRGGAHRGFRNFSFINGCFGLYGK